MNNKRGPVNLYLFWVYLIRYTVGWVYPAVGIHDVLGDLLYDAVDGVPDVLLGGDQQASRHQHYKRSLKYRIALFLLRAPKGRRRCTS